MPGFPTRRRERLGSIRDPECPSSAFPTDRGSGRGRALALLRHVSFIPLLAFAAAVGLMYIAATQNPHPDRSSAQQHAPAPQPAGDPATARARGPDAVADAVDRSTIRAASGDQGGQRQPQQAARADSVPPATTRPAVAVLDTRVPVGVRADGPAVAQEARPATSAAASTSLELAGKWNVTLFPPPSAYVSTRLRDRKARKEHARSSGGGSDTAATATGALTAAAEEGGAAGAVRENSNGTASSRINLGVIIADGPGVGGPLKYTLDAVLEGPDAVPPTNIVILTASSGAARDAACHVRGVTCLDWMAALEARPHDAPPHPYEKSYLDAFELGVRVLNASHGGGPLEGTGARGVPVSEMVAAHRREQVGNQAGGGVGKAEEEEDARSRGDPLTHYLFVAAFAMPSPGFLPRMRRAVAAAPGAIVGASWVVPSPPERHLKADATAEEAAATPGFWRVQNHGYSVEYDTRGRATLSGIFAGLSPWDARVAPPRSPLFRTPLTDLDALPPPRPPPASIRGIAAQAISPLCFIVSTRGLRAVGLNEWAPASTAAPAEGDGDGERAGDAGVNPASTRGDEAPHGDAHPAKPAKYDLLHKRFDSPEEALCRQKELTLALKALSNAGYVLITTRGTGLEALSRAEKQRVFDTASFVTSALHELEEVQRARPGVMWECKAATNLTQAAASLEAAALDVVDAADVDRVRAQDIFERVKVEISDLALEQKANLRLRRAAGWGQLAFAPLRTSDFIALLLDVEAATTVGGTNDGAVRDGFVTAYGAQVVCCYFQGNGGQLTAGGRLGRAADHAAGGGGSGDWRAVASWIDRTRADMRQLTSVPRAQAPATDDDGGAVTEPPEIVEERQRMAWARMDASQSAPFHMRLPLSTYDQTEFRSNLMAAYAPRFMRDDPRFTRNTSVFYSGHCCGCCGFSNEWLRFHVALERRIRMLSRNGIHCHCDGIPACEKNTVARLHASGRETLSHERRDDFLITVAHTPPWQYPAEEELIRPYTQRPSDYFIGRSMFEEDPLPGRWVGALRHWLVDEVWVPTDVARASFIAAGVSPGRVYVIPEAVETAFFDPASAVPVRALPAYWRKWSNRAGPLTDAPLDLSNEYIMLSVFKWEPRKGGDTLLMAYLNAFAERALPVDNQRPPVLVMVTYAFDRPDWPGGARDVMFFEDVLRNVSDAMGGARGRAKIAGKRAPHIVFITERLTETELLGLYAAADAFVLPTRGEGWGLPIAQAMAMALPVITTDASGPTEFITPTNAYPIRAEWRVISEDAPQRWAMPDENHLIELMRHVYLHPTEAKKVGREARADMVAYYSPDVVADMIMARFDAIEAHKPFLVERRRERQRREALLISSGMPDTNV